jgi:nucleoside 2-deoxyribosyltransferase
MRVYVASPLGFSEAGNAFYHDRLIPLLRQLGHEVLDPWQLTDRQRIDAVAAMPYGEARRDEWRRLNAEIGRNNQAAIDRCAALLAVLDGADVDSGTAAEIGYAFAKRKPIIGYRGDFRLAADNEGCIVNLQVEYFIRQSGGSIVGSLAELSDALVSLESEGRPPR